MLINLHHITSPLFSLAHTWLREPFSILWLLSSQWLSANISASMCLWFSIWPTEAPVDIFGNIPLEKLFALSGSPLLPYSNHIMYYLLANLQRKVEDQEPRKGRGRSGWIFILQFGEILFYQIEKCLIRRKVKEFSRKYEPLWSLWCPQCLR